MTQRMSNTRLAAIKTLRARYDDSPNEYVDDLIADLEETRDQRDDLMRKLVNLTPGGSEFAFNPDGCVKYLENERRGHIQLIVEKTAALHGAEKERDEVKEERFYWRTKAERLEEERDFWLRSAKNGEHDLKCANNFLNETKTALRNLVDAIVETTKDGPVLASHRIDKAVAEALAVLEEVENAE